MAFLRWLKNLFTSKKTQPAKPTKPRQSVDRPAPISSPDAVTMPWYEFALGELGVSESNNPDRVRWYHSFTTLAKKDQTPSTSWCASFVSAVLASSGYKSLKTAWARSYATYGSHLDKPKKGCIIGFERNAPGGDSHVGFFTGNETGTHYEVFGGNQSNSACFKMYPKKDFLYARWPEKEVGVDSSEDEPKTDGRVMADWDGSVSNPEKWTGILLKHLENYGQGMLRMANVRDADKWCPRFASLSYAQRKEFFVMLISSMARFESNFKPETTYQEGFKDAKGRPVISRGLLQMSIESVNQKAYGCGVASENDLHDVSENLRCGVIVLNHWITRDGVIGSDKRGGGRYWSVLRDTSGSQAKIRAKTLAWTKSL